MIARNPNKQLLLLLLLIVHTTHERAAPGGSRSLWRSSGSRRQSKTGASGVPPLISPQRWLMSLPQCLHLFLSIQSGCEVRIICGRRGRDRDEQLYQSVVTIPGVIRVSLSSIKVINVYIDLSPRAEEVYFGDQWCHKHAKQVQLENTIGASESKLNSKHPRPFR